MAAAYAGRRRALAERSKASEIAVEIVRARAMKPTTIYRSDPFSARVKFAQPTRPMRCHAGSSTRALFAVTPANRPPNRAAPNARARVFREAIDHLIAFYSE